MKYTTGLPTPKFADLIIRLREEGVEGYPVVYSIVMALLVNSWRLFLRHP